MSEAGKYDSVRVSADGVRILKRFAADEFPVPAIAFDISSGRDESVTLRLSDAVPEGVDVDDLGFHPDYGSEYWTIEENRITFERELEPNATYTTVYGIRAADDVSPFLQEPTIEAVDPPLPETEEGESIVLESDDALVEDAIGSGIASGASEEETSQEETAQEVDVPSTLDLGGTDGTDTDETDAPGETDAPDETDALDETDTDETAEQEVGAGTNTDEESSVELPAEGSLVATLATELRENSVPEEDLDLLREVLSEQDVAGSTTARLDRLQEDVAALRAYTSALEEFLDENGTGEELIASFEDQLDEFEANIDEFEERIEHLETEFVVEVRGRIEELEAEFETLESTVSGGIDRIDDIDQRADEIATRTDDADARTTELVGRLDDVETELEALDRLDDIEAELEDLADIQSELDRLDDIEEDIESIQNWKEQLIRTLGG